MTTPPPAKISRARVGKMNLLDAAIVALGSCTVLASCFLLSTYMAG